jgi:hypothetical protein
VKENARILSDLATRYGPDVAESVYERACIIAADLPPWRWEEALALASEMEQAHDPLAADNEPGRSSK